MTFSIFVSPRSSTFQNVKNHEKGSAEGGPAMTKFGQIQVWPDQVWPRPSLAKTKFGQTKFGQDQVWPNQTLCKIFCDLPKCPNWHKDNLLAAVLAKCGPIFGHFATLLPILGPTPYTLHPTPLNPLNPKPLNPSKCFCQHLAILGQTWSWPKLGPRPEGQGQIAGAAKERSTLASCGVDQRPHSWGQNLWFLGSGLGVGRPGRTVDALVSQK